MNQLVIVESPGKVPTIRKFLGAGYTVKASVGHIRDLPTKSLGVSRPDYQLTYEVKSDRRAVVADLRAAVRSADTVYLATDLDREGEAIAWHLASELRIKNAKRITFTEITKTAVLAGLRNARAIDLPRVYAQEARRAVDRIFGYDVSGALSRKGGRTLSAGRVQSVGLRLIVEREEAIRAFVVRDHFVVQLTFDGDAGPWTANWDFGAFLTPPETLWTDEPFAQRVAALRNVLVTNVDNKIARRSPPPPFTTSTYQQAASNRLKLGTAKAMELAQTLYTAGFITYMRTDSPVISDEAFAAITDYGRANKIEISPTKRGGKAKGRAEEAHEGIRPTTTKIAIRDCGLGGDLQRVYAMIWERTLASQMLDALYDARVVTVESVDRIDGKTMTFTARGRKINFLGWLALAKGDDATAKKADPIDSNPVPKLTSGTALRATNGRPIPRSTEPPERFTEATIVAALERNGVGRPSTYQSIVDKLQSRHYVELRQRIFHPLPLGEEVLRAIRHRFQFVEIDYTAAMENQLDLIAEGKLTYLQVVRDADTILQRELAAFAGVTLEGVALETAGPCPTCTTGKMTRHPMKTKAPARGSAKPAAGSTKGKPRKRAAAESTLAYFWSCSAYPTCTYSCDDVNGKPSMKQRAPKIEAGPCPTCKVGILRQITGPNGIFFGCSRWNAERNKCKATFAAINGQPDLRPATPCPKCQTGVLKSRNSTSGPFMGCSTYPTCNYTHNIAPETAA